MVHVVTSHLFTYLGQRVLFGHHSDVYIFHVHISKTRLFKYIENLTSKN